MNQRLRQIPCVFILRNKSHIHLKNAGYCTQGNVGKQLVPDEILNILMDFHLKSAAVKRLFQLRQEFFPILRQHPYIRITDSASSHMPWRQYRAVVLCRADDYTVFGDKFL